jgi:hypothetical protein
MDRQKVADFWDEYIHSWIEGEAALSRWLSNQHPSVVDGITRWRNSYQGAGKGALDLSCFPDPYVGDWRGLNGEPKLITLGLNPGIGYPSLQGRDGIWTSRIRESNYSSCLERSVPGDPINWLRQHKKESPYWIKLLNFGKRWHGDEFAYKDLLSIELYPWHSTCLTAGLDCPEDVVSKYILEPLSEFECKFVFAFGKPWEGVCRNAGLRVIRRCGEGGSPFPGVSCPGWTVVALKSLITPAIFIVSWQKGYAGPPGQDRILTLKTLLAELRP